MQRTSDTIWISFGQGDDHRLYAATVCSSVAANAEATFCRLDQAHEPEALLANSGDAVVYYHSPDGFLQQPTRLITDRADGSPTLRLEPVGIAAIAEDRRVRRVGVSYAERSAVVGGNDVCTIADASASGISVVSNSAYEPGQVVKVAFEIDDSVFSGYCRVRNIAPVRDQTRYGLLIMPDTDAGTLPTGLQRLTIAAAQDRAQAMPKAG